MTKMIPFIVGLFLFVFTETAFSSFNPQDFSGFEVNIVKEQKLETDVRIFAANVEIEGEITGEAVITGANVIVSGSIEKNVFIIAGNVKFSGRAGKNLLCSAGNIVLNGQYDDNVAVYGGKVAISGKFEKGLEIYAYELYVNPEAQIEGELKYAVESKAVISPEAKIVGGAKDISKETKERIASNLIVFNQVIAAFFLFSLLATGAVLNAVIPRFLHKIIGIISENVAQSFFVGFIALFAVPIGVVLIFVTVIGIPVALILTSAYFAMLYISLIFSGIFVGGMLISAVLKRHDLSMMLCLITGLLIIFIFGMLPAIGGIIIFIAITFGFGGLVLALFKRNDTPSTDEVIAENGLDTKE